jgi:hypothetical protein
MARIKERPLFILAIRVIRGSAAIANFRAAFRIAHSVACPEIRTRLALDCACWVKQAKYA